MKDKGLRKIKLGDNREVRVLRIQTGSGTLIRVGIHLMPKGTPVSGVVFPETALPAIIEALQASVPSHV